MFQGLKKDLQNSISKSNNLTNCLINVAVEARAEKAWLLYEFLFSLNPNDIPNDVGTWKNNSSSYPVITEDEF